MPGVNNVAANSVVVIPKPTVRFRRARSIDTLIIGETDMKRRDSPLSSEEIDAIIKPAKIDVGEKIGVYRHAYTHFKVTLHAFRCTLITKQPQAVEAQALAWVTLPELDDYPMGKIDRAIASDLQAERN